MKKTLSTLLAIFIIGGALAPMSSDAFFSLFRNVSKSSWITGSAKTSGARSYKSSSRLAI